MGLLSRLFGLETNCPECGTPGAKDGVAGARCLNQHCRSYDASYARLRGAGAEVPDPTSLETVAAGNRLVMAADVYQGPQGGISFAEPLEVEYRNFRGERKLFVIELAAVRDRGIFISVPVQPAGDSCIALRKENILNDEARNRIEERLARLPDPAARKVLDFHRERGSTSDRYEELRRKYPNY